MPPWRPYDKVQDHPATLRVARHEMGHYLAGRHFGFKVDGVTLQVDPNSGNFGTNSTSLPKPLKTLSEVQQYLEQRVMCLMAGICGEVVDLDETHDRAIIEEAQQNASQDMAKVRELLHLIRNIRHAKDPLTKADRQLKAIEDELMRRTSDFIKAERSLLDELATLLADKITDWKQTVSLSAKDLAKIASLRRRFPS